MMIMLMMILDGDTALASMGEKSGANGASAFQTK